MTTFFEKLQAAGLPVEYADETGQVTFSQPTTEAQRQQVKNIILEHFQPAAYTDDQQGEADRQTLRDGYPQALIDLNNIRTAQPPATIQAVWEALKTIATIQLAILKLAHRAWK